MTEQSRFAEIYKTAMKPIASRMDQAKWEITRAVTLGAAGLSTAIVFLITQIGVTSCSISISLFSAAIAIPTWIALWRVGETYSFYAPESHEYFATLQGSGPGLLLFVFGSILLLVEFVALIWHFSVVSALAFLIGSVCMVIFVYKHQAAVQAWVASGKSHDA